MNEHPIYLDYAATTPVDPRVAAKMQICLMDSTNLFGNPASTHYYGQAARKLLDDARQQVAALIHATPSEIIWTSGATEAINLAIRGVANSDQHNGKHIITCLTEHKAVLHTCQYLERQGFEVTYLTPQSNGLLNQEELSAAIRSDTILVSIMHVNNEIGVIQDIASIAEICRKNKILFHVDAAQSVGKIAIDLRAISIDLMSFTAHKIYGPKGIGALFVRARSKINLDPIIYGGGKKDSIRGGTLATHQIVGFGEACRVAKESMATEMPQWTLLRDRLWDGIKTLAGITLNGDEFTRIGTHLNIGVHGIEGSALLSTLKELAISSGAACAATNSEPSHVLRALGLSDQLAHSSLRISVGRYTTEADIDFAIEYLRERIEWLRECCARKDIK